MMNKQLLIIALAVVVVSGYHAGRASPQLGVDKPLSDSLDVDLKVDSETGEWSVTIGGDVWFDGTGLIATHKRKQYCAGFADRECNLLLPVSTRTYTGREAWGKYSATELTWKADSQRFVTTFKAFDDKRTLLFEQSFPDGMKDTGPGRVDMDLAVSAFPTLHPDAHGADRGYLQYLGGMIADGPHFGNWNANSTELGSGLMNTCPLVVFSKDGSKAAVWSVAESFMSVNQVFEPQPPAKLFWGLMGSVTSIPAGHRASVMMHVGSGINGAMQQWGAKLLSKYGKTRDYRDTDFGLNNLGYSTDNGAYYYYFTEKDKNYEDTLLDVKAYVDNISLPIRHILLDSWWYYKGEGDGVKTWAARPDIFPNGLQNLYNKTQWPAVAHNRYWSNDTTYAADWKFTIEPENSLAIPDEQEFWDWLMSSNSKWGLMTYEQDWLYNEFRGLNATLNSATRAREWLMQMGRAAQRYGMTIQYCMSWSRHMLQSVEIPVVTQARASGDYHPGNKQWRPMGLTSMLADAIAIRPSKDNWWSRPEPSWKDEGTDRETRNRLQSVVALLSTGPYTPGDKIGYADRDLIMRGVMEGGQLLQPDRPATCIDSNMLKRANSDWGGPTGEVWSTEATIDNMVFAYVLAVDLEEAYSLTPAELGLSGDYVAFETNSTNTVQDFSAKSPIQLPITDEWDFQYWTAAPRLENGWALLGEPSKWVSVSNARFSQIDAASGTNSTLTVTINGYPGEKVTVNYLMPSSDKVLSASCTMDASSTVRLSLPDKTCQNV